MIRLFLIALIALFPSMIKAQSYIYQYVDPCTKNIKFISVPLNGAAIAVTYYGQVGTFTNTDFNNGNFTAWLNQTSGANSGKPCDQATTQAVNTTNLIITNNIISTLTNITSVSTMAANLSANVASASSMVGGNLGNTVNNGSTGGGNSGGGGNNKNKNNNGNNSGNNSSNSNSSSSSAGNSQSGSSSQGSSGSVGSTNNQGNGTSGNNTGNSTGSGTTTGGGNSSGSAGTGQGSGSSSSGSTGQGSGSSGSSQGGGSSTQPPVGNTGSSGSTGTGSNGNTNGGGSGSTGGTGSTGGETGGLSQSNASGGNGGTTNSVANAAEATSSGSTTSSEGGSGSGSSGSSKNGDKNRARTGTLIGTGDIVAVRSAEEGESDQFKFTMSMTKSNTKNTFARGFLGNFTTQINNSNVTFYGAWTMPKTKTTIIAANSSMLNFEKDFFNTTTLLGSKRFTKLSLMGGVNFTLGNIGETKFQNLSAVGGGFYLFNVGKQKKVTGTLLVLGVYSPFTQFYEGQWWSSGLLVVPFSSWDYSITKKFKFNISFSGTYELNKNILNYQLLTGGKVML